MTLLKDFYRELSSTFDKNNAEKFVCEVELNATHPVYKGHFEQMPVAPGVCLTQMLQELLEKKFDMPLQLHSADNIKFLSLVVPQQNPNLYVEFNIKKEGQTLEASAIVTSGATTCMKFKGKFRSV
jgi:3-hydroxyacyl-[acyl-carrier-protein] dehydratase